jgi:hypothetical protein
MAAAGGGMELGMANKIMEKIRKIIFLAVIVFVLQGCELCQLIQYQLRWNIARERNSIIDANSNLDKPELDKIEKELDKLDQEAKNKGVQEINKEEYREFYTNIYNYHLRDAFLNSGAEKYLKMMEIDMKYKVLYMKYILKLRQENILRLTQGGLEFPVIDFRKWIGTQNISRMEDKLFKEIYKFESPPFYGAHKSSVKKIILKEGEKIQVGSCTVTTRKILGNDLSEIEVVFKGSDGIDVIRRSTQGKYSLNKAGSELKVLLINPMIASTDCLVHKPQGPCWDEIGQNQVLILNSESGACGLTFPKGDF